MRFHDKICLVTGTAAPPASASPAKAPASTSSNEQLATDN
jgi:hypothetical protein